MQAKIATKGIDNLFNLTKEKWLVMLKNPFKPIAEGTEEEDQMRYGTAGFFVFSNV